MGKPAQISVGRALLFTVASITFLIINSNVILLCLVSVYLQNFCYCFQTKNESGIGTSQWGDFEGFIPCSEWKILSSHCKNKQKKVSLNSCSHGNTFWDETCTKIVQNFWRCYYKGSVFDHQSMGGKIYIANKFYASNWIPLLLLLMSLCWSYIFLNFTSLPFVTITPLLTHYSACFHFFQVPLWGLSKPLLSQSF